MRVPIHAQATVKTSATFARLSLSQYSCLNTPHPTTSESNPCRIRRNPHLALAQGATETASYVGTTKYASVPPAQPQQCQVKLDVEELGNGLGMEGKEGQVGGT